MLKARNVIIILVVNYALLLVLSAFYEIQSLSSKASSLQMIIRTAGDLALEQSQVIDDFMAYGDRESYKLMMPSKDGSGFVLGDTMGGVFGLDSRVESNKELLFDKLYNNSELKELATRLGSMRKPIRYYNSTRTGFQWYYMPKAAMLGLDILPNTSSVRGIRDVSGGYISDSLANEIYSVYGLLSHEKTSGGESYYNTPVNLGITYFNEDLLGTLFMNNLDLLMRKKYTANLNTAEGGDGVLKGSTYASFVEGDLSQHNPINNGEFTILRGEENDSTGGVRTFSGITPSISYKVIDMYDSENDEILTSLFGAEKGGFSTKADYLKDQDKYNLNPATGQAYQTKSFVVAKVTFYVDVIIPYSSLVIRELQADLGDGANNFISLEQESPTGTEGTRRISYTRYFAVTP